MKTELNSTAELITSLSKLMSIIVSWQQDMCPNENKNYLQNASLLHSTVDLKKLLLLQHKPCTVSFKMKLSTPEDRCVEKHLESGENFSLDDKWATLKKK